MTELQTYLTFGVFAGVILAIAFNVIDMTLATLLGVSTLIVAGIFTQDDVLRTQQMAGGAIALLAARMARAMAPRSHM
jgi:Na+/H+ antiporter NhaD/arsenite permease-like protein